MLFCFSTIPQVKNQLIAEGGSVQGIPEIDAKTKALYKTAWELKQKLLVDMAADVRKFIPKKNNKKKIER